MQFIFLGQSLFKLTSLMHHSKWFSEISRHEKMHIQLKDFYLTLLTPTDGTPRQSILFVVAHFIKL